MKTNTNTNITIELLAELEALPHGELKHKLETLGISPVKLHRARKKFSDETVTELAVAQKIINKINPLISETIIATPGTFAVKYEVKHD